MFRFLGTFFGYKDGSSYAKVLWRVSATCLTVLLALFTGCFLYAFTTEVVIPKWISPSLNPEWESQRISNRVVFQKDYWSRKTRVYNEATGKVVFKDADWIEFKIDIPEKLPERIDRICNLIQERNNVHLRQITRKIVREEDYGHKIFKAINECYKNLYNFTVLPDHMADKYLDFYLSILDLRFISVVENEKNELVAFGITMPSIVRALQKCRGKLFPFGWWHVLKSLFWKREEGVEMLLVGVLPEYQNTGINSLIQADMFRKYAEFGVKWAETNAILETNIKNQGQFKDYNPECKKRRRSYIKKLEY